MSRALIMGHLQRLEPPFLTEAEPVAIVTYQSSVVFEMPSGERVVVDRDDLLDAISRPPLRAA